MKSSNTISRRKFLTKSGGATIVISGLYLFPGCGDGSSEDSKILEKEVSVWVRILTNGEVIIYTPAAEMGQGSKTSIPLILAEEMDADWSKVRILFSPVDAETYGLGWSPDQPKHLTTAGSRSVKSYYQLMRETGAQIRTALLLQAAKKWQVASDELMTEPGMVLHKSSNRKMSYGEIAGFGDFDQLPDIATVKLKDPKDFRLIGHTMPRHDIPSKTDGSAKFAMDVKLPGMLYGFINRSPAHGSKPELTNSKEIEAMEGIKAVVTLDHGVGVVATSIEFGLKARRHMQIKWGNTLSDSHNSDADLDAYSTDGAQEIMQEGDVEAALEKAEKVYEVAFTTKYAYHAHMEPLNAVVAVAPDKQSAEVWVGSQAPDRAQKEVAETLGIAPEQVKMNLFYLGGGFGRRSMSDYVAECAALAVHVDGPVKLIWMREDDIGYGAFRPQLKSFLKAAVDKKGDIIAWEHTAVGPGGNMAYRGAQMGHYDIPNVRLLHREMDHGIRTKHFRSVGHGTNKFGIETFVDQLARTHGQDPYRYRWNMLQGNDRARKVLERAVKMSNWDPKPKEGKAMGIAFADRDAYTCGVAQISLNRETGVIRVHRYWCACDGGVIVQPENARRQIEGAAIMGISLALKERIDIRSGKVVQTNYTDYNVLRMSEIPESIEIDFVNSGVAPHGLGETGVPAVAGAIASAFAALTGKHLYHLPFTPERVLEVLKG
ncbi:MAG: molybdopterin cofactor-binding domain-containing protein [Cyclobacteriaceae bacterium]